MRAYTEEGPGPFSVEYEAPVLGPESPVLGSESGTVL